MNKGFLLLTLVLFSGLSSAQVFQEDVIDAILGRSAPTPQELQELDVNEDGVVDIADAIAADPGVVDLSPDSLVGYVWTAVAIFGEGVTEDSRGPVMSYRFALRIADEGQGVEAEVTTLESFDPSKPLFAQNISPAGEVPGANRARYALSRVVPAGTPFSYSENGGMATLSSAAAPVEIAANDTSNPLGSLDGGGMTFSRTWSIEINVDEVLTGGIDHGKIVEATQDFPTKGGALSRMGRLYLFPYSPATLAVIPDTGDETKGAAR